jgi:acyl-CoA synthetase (AMP-forming)/AMP-acid ligase II
MRAVDDSGRNGFVTDQNSIPDDVRSATTFPKFVRAAAAAYGDAVAIALRNEDVVEDQLTFAELERKSAELARGLLARGVGKGTRVGYIYGNSPSFALLLAAIARIGAIAIPISTLIKSNELVRVLRQSDVAGLIVQREILGHDMVERLCEALPDLRQRADPDLRLPRTPFLRWIVSTGERLPGSVHDMSWLSETAGTVSEALLEEVESEVHAADQLIEIYTSGSMALPKGVKHNHGPALFRADSVRAATEITRGMEITAALPMFWVGGLNMYLLPNWQAGATTVCTDRTLNNSRLAMGSVLADEDLALISKVGVYWGLGMTETFGPYSWGDVLRVPGYPLCAPLDHIADRFEVRVWDEESQKEVPDGGVGEIQVRGYGLTPGLHKIERAGYFEPDGFYRTGDMGLVEGARIHFIGRNGDMIKTASANVSPAEVELEMQQLDGVHNAYVVGLPDKERGQLVVAGVVPREGAELDFAEIETKLRQRLSSYKVPRAYVALAREDVPMLHSNKVSRRQIERLLTERLGRA